MKVADLEWRVHSSMIAGAYHSTVFFDNGYGASVVKGGDGMLYTDDGTYELAVLKGTVASWELTYDTPITNDVLAYQSEEQANEALAQIEALPPR